MKLEVQLFQTLSSHLKSKASGPSDAQILPVYISESAANSKKAGAKTIPPSIFTPSPGFRELMTRLNQGQAFQARSGTFQTLRYLAPPPIEHLLLVGLGTPSQLTATTLRNTGGHAWTRLQSEKITHAVIALDDFKVSFGKETGSLNAISSLSYFLEGLVFHAYQFNKYKSQSKPLILERLTVVVRTAAEQKRIQALLEELAIVSEAVNLARDWSNEPSNHGTPQFFADQATQLAKKAGLKCRVLNEKHAEDEKMNLFLAVGRGSEQEGKVVVLEYTPKKVTKKTKTLALVGKGITFDSGGISIKPSTKMEDMKHDMTGAATIFAACVASSQLELEHRIVAVLGFTENMPDGQATQPGNIIRARNGKTVEIINTDAEGRLILADLLDYAHEFKPDFIVDLATLTGAVGIALGKQCGAILGNDEILIDSIRKASQATGERLWQLPLFDEYLEDMKGEHADLKNSCNDSHGGTIRGAIFLREFIRSGGKWAHLDIASMAYHLHTIPYFPKKGASGIYVRTLIEWMKHFVPSAKSR